MSGVPSADLLLSYFLKFYVGMIWYRCFAEGNLAELTGKILLIRTIFDFVFIYPMNNPRWKQYKFSWNVFNTI
jgi:hypothetical protein